MQALSAYVFYGIVALIAVLFVAYEAALAFLTG